MPDSLDINPNRLNDGSEAVTVMHLQTLPAYIYQH